MVCVGSHNQSRYHDHHLYPRATQCQSWRRSGWLHAGPCIPLTSWESVCSSCGFISCWLHHGKVLLPKGCLESCAGIWGPHFLTSELGLLESYGSAFRVLWQTLILCSCWAWVTKGDGYTCRAWLVQVHILFKVTREGRKGVSE